MGLTSDLGELGVPYEKDFDEMAEKAASGGALSIAGCL